MTLVSAYFNRVSEHRFEATIAVQGAWNTAEQHVAPVLGLIAHVAELDHAARGGSLTLARISHDIFGVLPITEVETSVRVLRPGRTIELVEVTLSSGGRAAVVSRVWFLQPAETAAVEATDLSQIASRETMPEYRPADAWPGQFIDALTLHRNLENPGRGQFWVNPPLPIIANEPISATARLLGIMDIANGMVARAAPEDVHYPNVDLTAHLFRAPRSDWLGFDTTVSFGPGGVGVTHSILHDEFGPIGTSMQSLTVRPRS